MTINDPRAVANIGNIIGFPATLDPDFLKTPFCQEQLDKMEPEEWIKPKTLEDWPWEGNLGKPYGDINGPVQGSPASEILKKASGLIDGERNAQHGDRKECHTLIAKMWSAYKGVDFSCEDVAMLMALLKIARTKSGAFNGDCYVDGAGYISLSGEFADAGC